LCVYLHRGNDKKTALCLAIGWDWVSWIFSLGWPQTTILLISASQVAGITGLSHSARPCEDCFN
jgi:hypothetical protein